MSELKQTNIPSMNIDSMVNKLSQVYTTAINKELPVKTIPSVMIWGPPGVGKSQAIRQIAKLIENNTGKTVVITDVRLLLFNPIDLRGIPTANADKTLAIWLKPQIFQMNQDSSTVNILFLDELSAAPQSVQTAAFQITLDRTIGEHKLPDNCIVIAAGNRTTDRSVAFKMPKALSNRLMHIAVDVNFDSWKQWAFNSGINKKVIGFLSFRQSYLMCFETDSEDLAFPTPRSWEMVSSILNNIEDNIDSMYPFIAGIVGTGTAIELRTWANVYKNLPSVEDIFDGKMPDVPKNTDALYALTTSMLSYARNHLKETDRIANSIRYADKMPPDFATILLRDYLHFGDDFKKNLMLIPEFSRWIQTKGFLINGSF